ncbi:hypothetical protein [Actinoalloteichus spitiensis]|uniref:hypothetical protein n=1 Tax=Actinoalloteichus spitiensis TaxID=252394 RepID=UPI00035E195E|nr:hypothetical protein [Actinoalloteichus spitiensis]
MVKRVRRTRQRIGRMVEAAGVVCTVAAEGLDLMGTSPGLVSATRRFGLGLRLLGGWLQR